MRRMEPRKTLFAAASVLVLGACQPAADQGENTPPDPAADPVAGEAVQDEIDAAPTASIFGPEAGVPEPDAEANASPAPESLKVTIGFPDGGAVLDADAVAELEKALGSDQLRMASLITLRAHSDAGGTVSANLDASQERGLAVAAWLIERGIAEETIEVIAFGAQNPAQPNAKLDGSPNALGRAANRRVELAADVSKIMPKSPEKDAGAK